LEPIMRRVAQIPMQIGAVGMSMNEALIV